MKKFLCLLNNIMNNIENQIENELQESLDDLKDFLFERNRILFKKNTENNIARILHLTGLSVLYNMLFYSFDFFYILLIAPSIFVLSLFINIIRFINRRKYIKNIKAIKEYKELNYD